MNYINYTFLYMMGDLGEYDIKEADVEILRWLRKITQSSTPKGISVANLDGDDVVWYGFTIKRLCHNNKRLKSYFQSGQKNESYFEKFANMNLIKLYPKNSMEKIFKDIDDLLDDESNGGQDKVIFFRFTSMQEHCLFEFPEDEEFVECENEFDDDDDLE